MMYSKMHSCSSSLSYCRLLRMWITRVYDFVTQTTGTLKMFVKPPIEEIKAETQGQYPGEVFSGLVKAFTEIFFLRPE